MSFKNRIWIFFVFIIIGLGGVLLYFKQDYQHYTHTAIKLSQDRLFLLEKGSNFRQISQKLVDNNIIDNPYYWEILARLTNQTGQLKAGEYALASNETPIELLQRFVEGKTVHYKLTLIEGWNIKQTLLAVAKNDHLKAVLKNIPYPQIKEKLGLDILHLEGQFFPDTYVFSKPYQDITLLQQAHKKLQQVLQQEWQNRADNLPYKTAYEALIMASIIEKETGKASERAMIAAVFIRRLGKNMRLQTDPTVIYGMGARYKGNIRRKDLKEDTPYNTYVHKGLPPTPIAMVGRASIHAALHPAKGKYLYFVAKGNGAHYFSKTLREHNRAVRKYQR